MASEELASPWAKLGLASLTLVGLALKVERLLPVSLEVWRCADARVGVCVCGRVRGLWG